MSLLHQRGLVHGPDPAIHVLLCVRTEEICPHPAVFCLWANHRVLIVNVGAHSRVGRLWKTQIKSREDGDKKNILKDCKTTPWCWQSWYWQHINPVNCSLSYCSPQKQCFKKLQSKQAFEAVSAAVTGSWKGEGRRQVTHTHTQRETTTHSGYQMGYCHETEHLNPEAGKQLNGSSLKWHPTCLSMLKIEIGTRQQVCIRLCVFDYGQIGTRSHAKRPACADFHSCFLSNQCYEKNCLL